VSAPVKRSAAPWRLPELLAGIAPAAPALTVQGLSADSRRIAAGDLFLALRGARHDGRAYLGQAAASGAVAALVEEMPGQAAPLPVCVVPELARRVGEIASRFHGEPSRALHIAAVTGTNGKTTVSQLLAQLIRAAGYECGVIGTLGAALDHRLAGAQHTTPDPVSLQATLAGWVDMAVPFVSMEASSHALDQGRMDGVEVDTALFTNLTRDHLDYHGDMQRYGAAKARLFQLPGLRTALLNSDDRFSDTLAAALPEGVACLRFALDDAGADLRLENLRCDARGLSARLVSPWGEAALRCPLLGRFNASNLAAALAAALTAGIPLDTVIGAVERLQPVPGRMEPLRERGAPLVVVDYAHTPDALAQVLAALRPQVAGRLVVVFGCGGDRDRGKRVEMARAASAGADHAVLTSDNPRSEDPLAIIRDIEQGMSGSFHSIADRAEAIASAVAGAGARDCVVIAGKGHEDYQVVGDTRLPFSDREQARLALRERAA
jgi:UDP-N-acetylmuramoyl-L-alanyl-D-glutamate--2,6-diaminopimelate ligase